MTRQLVTQRYSILKATEGGPGQKWAVDVARRLGAAKVRPEPSIYIGNTDIVVTATSAQHRAILDALFN